MTEQTKHLVGWQRYEKVRKLNLVEIAELYKRNLKGERLDDMVDALERPNEPTLKEIP